MAPKLDTTSVINVLLVLTSIVSLVLGALSWNSTDVVFLPLPTWLPVLATFLPIFTGFTIATARFLLKNNTNYRAHMLQVLNHAHTMLTTVIGVIALAYIYPEATLACHLNEKWQYFFQHKDVRAIRSIQDRFQCCGLRSTLDRAWPFRDREHGNNACELQLGYRRSCLGPWRDTQRNASWMVFAAAAMSAQLFRRRASWMSTRLRGNGREPQRISEARPEEADGDTEADAEPRRTLLPQSRPGQENMWDVD
ncbi:hypothetical protein BJX61DRAFT_538703 [Aspergillus egyptiacus]|nr:hypothetical protein BJX61DRAFT_538703 [Aspergillus egyptiacus]